MAEPGALVIRWWLAKPRAIAAYATVSAMLLLVLAVRTSGLFMELHRVLMGAGAALLIYFAVARLINVTELRVEAGTLVVRHGPLPWRGRTIIPIVRVDEIAVDRAAHRLQLRTVEGDELILLEELDASAAARVADDVAHMWNAAR